MNACMASTMVIGVNHVNLSTDVEKPAANAILRVSYPVDSRMFWGPNYRTKAKSLTHLASLEER